MDIKQNNINNIDLMLITNNKLHKITNHNETNNDNDIYKTDKYKFYRKRIFKLIKDIMNKKINDENMKLSFSCFIKDALEYIEFNDKSDLLQEKYRYENDKVIIQDNHTNKLDVIPEVNEESDEYEEQDIKSIDINKANNFIHNINYKKKSHYQKNNNISKLLNIKTISHKKETDDKSNYTIPKQIEYNLFEPSLKYKGL